MRAIVTNGNMDISLQEIPRPRPGPGQVLIKIRSVGICGSDIPRVLDRVCPVYPTVLGHEFCGEVVEAAVDVTTLRPGQRVAGIPLVPCFGCGACRQGLYGQCDDFQFLGTKLPGAMAEYLVADQRNLFPIENTIDDYQGAMFEPATVAVHAILRLGYDPDQPVAVIGCGTIGLMAIQCLRAMGAGHIVAVDVDDAQLDKAARLGANRAVRSDRAAEVESLAAIGIVQILECVGIPATLRLALSIAGPRAAAMLVGIPTEDIGLTPADFDHISRRELTLKGCWMSYSPPFPGEEWHMVAQFFRENKLHIHQMIEDEIPLEQVPALFRQIREGRRLHGKILVRP